MADGRCGPYESWTGFEGRKYDQKAGEILDVLWGKRIDYGVIGDYFGYTKTNATVRGIYDAVKDYANQFGADPEDWPEAGDVEMQSNEQELLDTCIGLFRDRPPH